MTTVAEIFSSMAYGPAPEGDAEARAWLAAHGNAFGHFIGGAFTRPGKGGFETKEPATGKTLARIAQGSATDVDAAVAAAAGALPAWQALSGHARARHLYALARMVQRHSRLFAVVEALDNGKSIRETRDLDIPLVARHFYHHAGWAQLLASEFPGHEAAGVVGQVIPWNFPLLMLAWKVAPALAAGCTVVLKPAEYTSLTALLFAELAHAAGLPAGVLNIVTGDGRTGAALVEHPGIAKVAFTGSTEVGRIIRKALAGSGKSLTLELGGKSPFLVYEDADLDAAVEGVVDAIWFNQGQVCCAGSRLLVQESVHDVFVAKLRARMETLRVGGPLDKAIDMGAIVDPVQRDRIAGLVAQGEAQGATRWQPSWAVPAQGCWYPPTLFTNVESSNIIAREEIFGPVLVTMPFRTPAESVALANNTPYGLAASVWSENINLALDIAPRLKAGVVWINATNLFDAAAGFGGYRESGYGREGGREGIAEYLKASWEKKVESAYRVTRHASRVPRGGDAGRETRDEGRGTGRPVVDRTAKLFIGGTQTRPDSGYSRVIVDPRGRSIGEVGEGNRKDLRNAVEAAQAAAPAWAAMSGHARAQILYYVAENLSARAGEFAERIRQQTGATPADAATEVELTIERLFTYGAWADKYDGAIHSVPIRGVALAFHEPIGVVAAVAPADCPLLGLVSFIAPLMATGNTVVAVPSERHPLSAIDLYQVLETSDVPSGVVNIVTGGRESLARTLAEHDDVEAIWYHGSHEGATAVEQTSVGNLKRTWARWWPVDWMQAEQGEGRQYLRQAVQVKNVWIPWGE
jgi:aldehyde dehydrogenase (NAD+)